MPEVRRVLDDHLNTDKDPALSIRSLYGFHFPRLMAFDTEWAAANLPRIFPHEARLTQFRSAAWDGYIGFCNAWRGALPVLRAEYLAAIDRIGDNSSDRRLEGAPDRIRLTEHAC